MELAPALASDQGAPPMHQPQLFIVPCRFQFRVSLELDGTWSVWSCKAYEGRPSGDFDTDTYSRLSLAEAVDVVAATLFTL